MIVVYRDYSCSVVVVPFMTPQLCGHWIKQKALLSIIVVCISRLSHICYVDLLLTDFLSLFLIFTILKFLKRQDIIMELWQIENIFYS